MATERYGAYCHETHDQFVQRASRIFPEEGVRCWSRIERAVFNHLLSRLINQHGYDSISTQMLEDSRDNMKELVHRLTGGSPGNAAPGA